MDSKSESGEREFYFLCLFLFEMPLYLFGEDARKFLRMQGSNLRIGDAFCVEIDECGEWYVRPVKDTIRNISGAVASKKREISIFLTLSSRK